MAQSGADRNLLFGVLALQMDFIARDALIGAMNTWATEKDKSLGQVLRSQGALSEGDDALLDSLVRRLMELHDDDARRSLAAVTTVSANRRDLEGVADPELSFSVAAWADAAEKTAPHPCAGSDHTAGASSSGGPRFHPLRCHARGGMGEVWIARDTELQRDVALKQLQDHCTDDPRSRARFLHEARVTGALEHRGIAPVYGLGQFADGRPFYAMQFIGGVSLKKAIETFYDAGAPMQTSDERSLQLRRLLGRFVDVCNTVAYAHSRGVLHRDLKPGNIVLDDFGETLVVDWGLARSGCRDAGSSSTQAAIPPISAGDLPSTLAGAAMGTPAYMSPEQVTGRVAELGPATDVYSLGATLYCLLTGQPPFQGQDPSVILPRVAAGDFPRPRRVLPSVPAALEAICLKAMALEPAARYSTARALAEDLERWLADQPVLAYPEPFPARAVRWVRRRKQWVAAAAALLVLSLLGLVIHDRQITREQGRTADQLGMTRDALRELLEVSGQNLAFIPNTEKLREYLARGVLDRYRQLGERFPNDPGVRLETAQVYRVIGGIGRITGQFAKSRESYEQAIEVLTGLCEKDPGHADYRRWLVEAFIDRGELNHMNGRTIDAEKDFHAAIGHADKLLSLPISQSDYRRAKAPALINLSEILVLEGRHEVAHTAADQAVGLLRSLAGSAQDPDSTSRDRWLLSLALTDRGIASGEAGHGDRASQDFDEAEGVAGQITREDELYDDAQFQIACVSNQRGGLLGKDPSRLSESARDYEQASRILERLIRDHKLIPHYREEMTVALSGRAAVRLAMGRVADARRDCEAARDHLGWLIGEQERKGAPENPQYLSLLGQVLARQGRIHLLQGRADEGRKAVSEAAEKLSRAIRIDPARVADRAILDRIKADPAPSGP